MAEILSKLYLEGAEAVEKWLAQNAALPEDLRREIKGKLEIARRQFDEGNLILQESDEAEPIGLILDVWQSDEVIHSWQWNYDDWG